MHNAADLLQSKNIRPSMQRVHVLHYLMERKNHPTVDTIYEDLLPDMPTLSRTTIYNTLDTLCENGLVQRLDMDEGSVRYDATMNEHSHFLCKKCGTVYDLEISAASLSQNMPKGFELQDSKLYAFGVCAKCR